MFISNIDVGLSTDGTIGLGGLIGCFDINGIGTAMFCHFFEVSVIPNISFRNIFPNKLWPLKEYKISEGMQAECLHFHFFE